MKTLKRIKKYKAELPEKTVTNIRTILCEKLGIILEEADFKSEGGFYSTRIKIGNYNLSDLDYGTNGKAWRVYGEDAELGYNSFQFFSV